MKVCLTFASKGKKAGIEQHVMELYKFLKDNDVDVKVLASKDYKKYFNNCDFIEYEYASRKNIFASFKLLKKLKKHNFDIIHTHGNKATDIIVFLKKFLNVKIVSTIHSLKKKVYSFEKTDFVIGVSSFVLKNIKNSKKTVIYNATDIKKNNLAKFNKWTLIFIGRLEKVKRVENLIDNLQKAGYSRKLLIVGDGSLREKVERMSKKVNFEIEITGFLERDEALELLEKSHLCVINSAKEGFPYVFVESLLLETPVISTDISDVKKFINEWVYNSFEEFKEKLDYIQNNYNEFYKGYENIFQKAKKEFSLKTMGEKTLEVYKKVLL